MPWNPLSFFSKAPAPKPMKTASNRARIPKTAEARLPGFALIVTLSLMILLTVIAVGLLTLSSISLRSSNQGDAMNQARANARMALILAIGDLQKQLGPDTRISVTSDQRPAGSNSEETSAALGNRHWTGVYDSWPTPKPGDLADNRPEPIFRSWLMSGDASRLASPLSADTELSGTEIIELIGKGTLGEANRSVVKVPSINCLQRNGKQAKMAWWIGDDGVKAAIGTPPPSTDSSMATLRANLQSAPRNATSLASTADGKPFGNLAADDSRIQLISSWKQSAFLASNIEAPRPLFHDLVANSSGLMTNVRAGGFRKDLSMQLERTDPGQIPATPLYTVGGEGGINLRELWGYYTLYKSGANTLQRSGTANYTTGGSMSSGTPYLQVKNTPSECLQDDYFFYKQPVILSYQMVLSFETLPATFTVNNVQVQGYQLRVVADPILTLWNPLDVPVVVPTSAFMSVKYWQYPYDINVRINNGTPIRCPLISSLSGATTTSSSDYNFLSLKFGAQQQMVFKPGEIMKISQNSPVIRRDAFDRNLDGKAGFNHFGGLSLPVKDLTGKPIYMRPTDFFNYDVKANNLTAGKTGSSGNSLTGANLHTRHFSTTHHEVYIGEDRGTSSNSVGIGGMYIDWDFGNRRLKAGEVRGSGQGGTKPPTQRIYADLKTDVFKPIVSADTRKFIAQEITGRKAPFMIMSFESKTEMGADADTRFLSRFNPKALHVDFYDLTRKERDTLPYEFKVDPLTSWINRSIELSPNGNAYYGGGMNAEFGSSFISTHSVPREPVVSLAAFQHSFANGFEMLRPTYGYATLNGREPMQPQIAHAIGNSMAPPMMTPDKTEGTLGGGRPLADHSYLANRALWDDWFLSGIAPQTVKSYGLSRDQKTVATEFLNGKTPLPVVRYRPSIGSASPTTLVNSLFSGTTPTNTATELVAALMRVDGMFNVNSTSVQAWKSILGNLKDRPVVARNLTGSETVATTPAGSVPIANLAAPHDGIAKGTGVVDVKENEQWIGRRTLSDDEIDKLARAIVSEVRKRGPFLSMADFVNRRVGSDKALARAGAIQSALDSTEAKINDAYVSGNRSVSGATSSRFDFPEAESGPKGFGAPGIVKQGDILTPIAPILSVRSDSFTIRAYGESVDGNNKVVAQAWCEAKVERDRNFVDSSDLPQTLLAGLKNNVNKVFGRRFEMVSFRWLDNKEV
jgi:hypothetical protein